jgi:hypothetical protein
MPILNRIDTLQPITPTLPCTAKLPCLLRGSFYRFSKCTSAFYAIGKITKNGWRSGFDVEMPCNTWDEYLKTTPVPTHFGFVYTGPFFIRCDHGCSHFTGSHATTSECIPNDADFRPGRVFRRCERQIQQAGFVFVWAGVGDDALDTAHGSLVEIGIAHALRKPILFAHHPQANLRDFWFAVETASAVVCTDRPLTALEMLGADLDRFARGHR